MHLVFGSCRVPTCYNTALVGLLASILNRLLAAGLSSPHSQVCLRRLFTSAGMGLDEKSSEPDALSSAATLDAGRRVCANIYREINKVEPREMFKKITENIQELPRSSL